MSSLLMASTTKHQPLKIAFRGEEHEVFERGGNRNCRTDQVNSWPPAVVHPPDWNQNLQTCQNFVSLD